jgi:hypothetical protein
MNIPRLRHALPVVLATLLLSLLAPSSTRADGGFTRRDVA